MLVNKVGSNCCACISGEMEIANRNPIKIFFFIYNQLANVTMMKIDRNGNLESKPE
jgi:hypothetical protein